MAEWRRRYSRARALTLTGTVVQAGVHFRLLGAPEWTRAMGEGRVKRSYGPRIQDATTRCFQKS
jgi:hypothetical protein